MQRIEWNNPGNLASKKYTCSYCGSPIASEKGWVADKSRGQIFICHKCTRPTFFDNTEGSKQYPGVVFGNSVSNIPEKSVASLYAEARNCTGAGAYTAAVLCCRKLLMHIAVSKDADKGKSFVYYVDYLAKKHYIPPDAKDWVDHIRQKGNETNHEIVIMPKEEAEELLSFSEMLLKMIFEFPAKVKKKYTSKDKTNT